MGEPVTIDWIEMVWWILAGVAIIAATVYGYNTAGKVYVGKHRPERAVGAAVAVLFIAGAIATGLNLAFMQVGYKTQVKETWSAPLAELRDGTSGVHGSFFLGIGSISGGSPNYTYYEKDPDGSYSLQSLDTQWDTVRVFQDNQGPKVVCRQVVRTQNHDSTWSIFGAVVNHHDYCLTWDFHVPQGTIVSNYHLDAQ